MTPGHELDLSVVVPAFNEELRLPPSLDRIHDFLAARDWRYEVVVADDGSRDRTAELVRQRARTWPQLRLVALPENRGKGAAVQAGMLAATGRRRLFTDADLSTPIEEMDRLAARIDGGAEIAIGSRAVDGSRVELHQPAYRELMGKSYNRLLRLLVLPGLHDTQCGFKLFTARAARLCFSELECPGFGFDAEVLLRACRSGLSVVEVGVVWRNASGTSVNSMSDSLKMLAELWRLRRMRGSLEPVTEHP